MTSSVATVYNLQEDLAERASWVLAEEEVLLMEQQAAGGGAAAATGASTAGQEALANSPSSILDGLTATDINKMKVRRACSSQGSERVGGATKGTGSAQAALLAICPAPGQATCCPAPGQATCMPQTLRP